MQKLIKWCKTWGFTAASLFLLAFIPLYPKLPLLDIRNTWVYVRVEDFLVLFVLLAWGITLVKDKPLIKSPITIPVLLFWLAGGLATIHSILLIVPVVWDIFPNVAFLSFLRRIEYMSLFFVAVAAVRDKRAIFPIAVTTVGTVLAVSLYGVGQKYMGLPAYLTMNEEFAKGIPLTLSALSRVSSTFGGHYDLAAFLVLTLPIVVSILFATRHLILKLLLVGVFALGFFVLFMTVSRISVFALFISIGLVLFFQRRKLVLLLLPMGAIGVLVLLAFAPGLVDRFGSTVKTVDVLVDAKSGHPIGHVRVVPNTYFENKIVRQYMYDSIGDVTVLASPSAKFIVPYTELNPEVVVLTEPTAPTGEDLPSGTGYINLTLSPDIKRVGEFFYEPDLRESTTSAEAYVINGQYLIKRAAAYDLSFTTRFQGEWPHAIEAFKRNILFGSGYGSVSLAVDNSYLRMLAEVGLLGFVSFVSIFLLFGVYLYRVLPTVENPLTKSVAWGLAAGIVGLSINAVFIDVFEASKVAFTLWLLMGLVLGVLGVATPKISVNFVAEMKRIASSYPAIIVYLFVAMSLLWLPLTRNYFIGDDFTWLRWAADCTNLSAMTEGCGLRLSSIATYLTDAGGFFYRPATKLYFAFMYQAFWLNQTVYHIVSLALHFLVSICVFFLGLRMFKSKMLGAMSAFVFIWLSGFSEAVFWIAATGHMFATLLMLLSFFSYSAWRERKNGWFFVASIIAFALSLGFHEMGVVTPLLFLLYELSVSDNPMSFRAMTKNIWHWVLLLPLPVYAIMRLLSGSHWLSGDYNFNLLKFPVNAVGNALGYFFITLVGSYGTTISQVLRAVLRDNLIVAVILLVLGAAGSVYLYRIIRASIDPWEKRIIRFSLLFFGISLLPFFGLGNIAPRYGYTASIGVVMLIIYVMSKLYAVLLINGRDIARIVMAVIVSIFVLFHSVFMHQLHQDWNQAGDMVKRFIISMDSAYIDEWAVAPMEMHFVNIPIRHGEAWVFPVGISDALWFVYRNPNIKIYTWSTVEEALSAVTYNSMTQKIFVFKSDGSVQEVKKAPSEATK
jgi:hypothetical protein